MGPRSRAAPEGADVLVDRSFATTVMRTVYGIDLSGGEEECFRMGETITRIGIEMSTPGAFPVDTFAVLRYLPSWLPGVQFKKIAAAWKTRSSEYRDKLYSLGVEALVSVMFIIGPRSRGNISVLRKTGAARILS